MKKIIPAVLAILIMCCPGCSTREIECRTPVVFYYCVDKLDYTSSSPTIQGEERTLDCPPNDYTTIMQHYLEGPAQRGMYSPFPKDLTVTELLIDGDTTHVTFSTNLSYLTGVDLTLACVCIANTCLSLTHTQNIDISAEHALLDNAPSVFISNSSILTSDIY